MARRLGCKGTVAIVPVVGMAIILVAAMSNVRVRVLLVAAEDVVNAIPHLLAQISEESAETHG